MPPPLASAQWQCIWMGMNHPDKFMVCVLMLLLLLQLQGVMYPLL
jgi:hypothetical protein